MKNLKLMSNKKPAWFSNPSKRNVKTWRRTHTKVCIEKGNNDSKHLSSEQQNVGVFSQLAARADFRMDIIGSSYSNHDTSATITVLRQDE